MAGKKITAVSRILLIQNDKASLYAWKKQQLLELGVFTANEAGLLAFTRLLYDDKASSISVVVDCIEEDFRHEVVAHVQGRDRTEMLKRKESLLFRNTSYRIARLLGRETTGRRDDKVLFSALSKPEIVSYWLNPVLAAKVSIRAITSASYLMEQLARQEGLHKQDHVLLVSVEHSSGIRQTYLQKGKLMFSRLLPMRPGQDSSVFTLIEEQAIQTRKYLERIKLIPYEGALDTIVYMEFLHNNIPADRVSEQMHFIYRDASTLDGYDLIDTDDNKMGGCLLPVIARSLKKSSLTNTYGQVTDRRYHFFSLASKSLMAASIALVILILLTTTPLLLEGMSNSEQRERMQAQTGPLLNDYERLRQRFPDTPIPSNSMALIVETYDKLATEVINPRVLMSHIGEVLTASPHVRLSNVEWAVVEQPSAVDQALYSATTLTDSQRYIQSDLDRKMQITAQLEGSVLETFSIREAHEQVTEFMAAIERQTGGVVTPVSLPLDISSVSSLELTLDDAPVAAGFVLQLQIIPPSQIHEQTEEDGM